jgi:hypothetical protein
MIDPRPTESGSMPGSLKSLLVFSFYVFGLALSLLIAPNFFLRMLGIPTTTEVWVRCAGMLLLGYGFYYACVLRSRMVEFLPFTVYVRSLVIVFFSVFVALGWARPVFIVFGVIDLAGAIWTAAALRSERKGAAARRPQAEERLQ